MHTTPTDPVLVTGPSGFLGQRLVRRLAEDQRRVFCLVRPRSLVDGLRSTDAQLITGDVTDRGSVERALAASRARVVFHLAGVVRARRWGAGSGDFSHVNTGGVENVAAACAACSDPPVLVVVSSLAAAGPSPAGQPRVESDAPAPVSNYGRSKLAGEQAAAKYSASVPITVVRPPIVFGPGDRAMLEAFRTIDRWGMHIVPGRRAAGHSVSLIYVDDLVEGLLLVAAKGERLRQDGPTGKGTYFMSGESCPTYADFGLSMAKALGRKPPTLIHLPGPLLALVGLGGDLVASLRRTPGWINGDKMTEAKAASWTCSSAKAREQLGWSVGPEFTLADRLRQSVEWYRDSGWL